MADTPLPANYGIPLYLLQPGLIAGIRSRNAGQAEIDRAAPYTKLYAEMGPDYQERLHALARDGSVPLHALLQLYKEWQAAQSRRPPPAILGVRASLRDTTESDIA